ncbi:geminin-like [Sipha flava]|uniref:Geminin-like n=1 Tax=Sipha flava TaxID=143950 RepID=A0A8B8G153_9HEMI|nr:geminin-like [Sipha flava]
MKTVSENANRNVSDKTSNKKSTRKFLQTLQPSGSGKENLVGTGRFAEKNTDKISKSPVKTEIEVNSKDNKSVIAKVNPSLYKKLIIDDLTSVAGPSEKYWEVIAERRRKALEDVLEQNRRLHSVIIALEEENATCKHLLDQTTDLVNTLKEVMNSEENNETTEEVDEHFSIDSETLNSDIDNSVNESE